MATNAYFSSLIAFKYDRLYDEIRNFMENHPTVNLYSGSFDTLGLSSYATTSDGLQVLKGHRNWLWFSIFEDMTANGLCFKKSVMSASGRKVLYNLYSATPVEGVQRHWIRLQEGANIVHSVNELFRTATDYVRTFPATVFTVKLMTKTGGAISQCTTETGSVRPGHKNWLYFSVLEQLTVGGVLQKVRRGSYIASV